MYKKITGTITMVMNNMISSVNRLDAESQSVRLLRGSSDDGMTNGNIAQPAVRMIPVTCSPVAMNVGTPLRRPAVMHASRPATMATSGASKVSG